MTTTPERFTAHSLIDLVEVAPSLIGFQPEESLVLMVLEHGSIALTARIDLEGTAHAVHDQFLPVWARFPTASYVVVAFTADPDRAWASLFTLDEALPDTERSLVHADGVRCHFLPGDEGEPYDAVSGRLAVKAAVAGVEVLPSRSELFRLLEPTVEPGQVEEALARLAEVDNGVKVLDRAAELLAAADAGAAPPNLDDALVLGMGCLSHGFLDDVMFSTNRANAPARRDLWAAVVRSFVPRYAGPALEALGLAAWQCGQGALMTVCLERLSGLPGDPLWAGVLDQISATALPPDEWPAFAERIQDAVNAVFEDPADDEHDPVWERVDALNRVDAASGSRVWARSVRGGRTPSLRSRDRGHCRRRSGARRQR